jgi:xanthine dehydrogenase accessory factor
MQVFKKKPLVVLVPRRGDKQMSDLGTVLTLWQEASRSGEDYILATIVAVEGSSYRKPGARMLVTKSGRRAGTISGGCLEAEVSTKAWWHTEKGPIVKKYATSFDMDDDAPPYGLGCGGIVYVLLERRATADRLLQALASAFQCRTPSGVATVIEGSAIGTHILADEKSIPGAELSDPQIIELSGFASRTLDAGQSLGCLAVPEMENASKIFAEYVAARPGLFVFGAGDDARPLVTQARTLNWHIVVADGRSHLATRERFPEADSITVLKSQEFPSLRDRDAAVLMTHSYEQDRFLLTKLLHMPLGYLGILGPRHRTNYILDNIAEELGGNRETYLDKLHSPTGLDLGAETAATIALSIVAEIQANFHHSSAAHLRDIKQQSAQPVLVEQLQKA